MGWLGTTNKFYGSQGEKEKKLVFKTKKKLCDFFNAIK